MFKQFLILFVPILMLVSGLSHAQPYVQWSHLYGGANDEDAFRVRQTNNSGMIIVGYTYSYGAGMSDVYLIKTNSLGEIIWTKTYGGPKIDAGYDVQQTFDGGYIVAGYTFSYGAGAEEVYLIKTDSQGDVVWTKTYGGSGQDIGTCVKQTPNGGYIIGGITESFAIAYDDAYVIRTDQDGNVIWTRTWDKGLNDNRVHEIQLADDGGFIVGGFYWWANGFRMDASLIKLDANGATVWDRSYDGVYRALGSLFEKTNDGGFIMTGLTEPTLYVPTDVYLVKTDADGNEMWEKSYGEVDVYERGESVQQTSDAGYIIAGVSGQVGNHLVIKTDADGEVLWDTTFGGSGDDWAHYTVETFDKAFLVVGRNSSSGTGDMDIWLYKLIESPQEAIEYTIDDVEELVNSGILNQGQGNALIVKLNTAIKKLRQGKPKTSINVLKAFINQVNAFINGDALSYSDGQVLIYTAEGIIGQIVTLYPGMNNEPAVAGSSDEIIPMQNYPNPFNPSTTFEFDLPTSKVVTLKVFNILGEELATIVSGRLPAGSYSYEWDASNLASGVYMYRLEADGFVETRKMILMK